MNNVNQTHSGNPINSANPQPNSRHSSFDDSYNFLSTMRFGEITPHFVAETVPSDNLSLQSSHSLRTFTFKSPLMQDMTIKKDYFAVPLMSILPNNFEKFYETPKLGDDVLDDVGCAVSNPRQFIAEFLNYFFDVAYNLYSDLSNASDVSDDEVKSWLVGYINALICSEYFVSKGSLLNYLGYDLSCLVDNTEFTDFDAYFDSCFSKLFKFCDDNSLLLQVTFYNNDFIAYGLNHLSAHRFLEIIRDNGGIASAEFIGDDYPLIDSLTDVIDNVPEAICDDTSFTNDVPLNLARLFAYQIACAHFYTNDNVDYVYSAELYRQNLLSVTGTNSFTWNGITCIYDACSAFNFAYLFDVSGSGFAFDKVFAYLSLVFAYRHSLRYMDYFTGSRTRPLAIGNVDIPVSASDTVSVIDVTRNIQIQRFFNAVNRTGRKISEYIKGLFGNDVQYDYHNPMFLGHTSDSVFANEVSNTGDSQVTDPNSVTSLLKSNGNRYAFEFNSDVPAIVIGLTSFDIMRFYSKSSERSMMHSNRFDMFNPYLEHVGDQPIFGREIDTFNSFSAFGYTSRYMEYKQRFNRAVGGFVKNLPGFAFLADNVVGLSLPSNISPSYIRSSNVELDEFYLSLTGLSLASYFHFIVFSGNSFYAQRPMSYNPQIL